MPDSSIPTPVEVSEEMVERAARSLADHIDMGLPVPDYLRHYARGAVEAALAGRVVVQLPEPSDIDTGQHGGLRPVARWVVHDFEVSAVNTPSGPHVNVRGGAYLRAEQAERRAGALLAAAGEARRLAAESSESSDPT